MGIISAFRRRARRGAGSTTLPTPAVPAIPNSPIPSAGAENTYFNTSWLSERAKQFDVMMGTSPSYDALVMTDGPIGYWRLGENGGFSKAMKGAGPVGYWRVGETSGPTAVDLSGNNRNGVFSAGCTRGVDGLTADGDRAVQLNGADSINMGDVPAFEFVSAFSVACLVKYTSTGALTPLVAKCDGGFNGWGLFQYSGTGYIQFFAFTSAGATLWNFNTSALLVPLNDGLKHLVVATWDGTTNANGVKIYVDGLVVVQATSAAGTPDANAANFLVGTSGAGGFYTGVIDEVAVFNYALSAAQIANLWALRDSAVTGLTVPVACEASGHSLPGAYSAPVMFGGAGLTGDGPLAPDFSNAPGARVDIPSVPVPLLPTLECVFIRTASALVGGFNRIWTSGSTASFPLDLGLTGANKLQFFINFTTLSPGWIDTGFPVVLGTPYHCAVTWDGDHFRMYINGVLVYDFAGWSGRIMINAGSTLGVRAIGNLASEDGGTGFEFPGRIGKVALYDHALTQAQILAHVAGMPYVPTLVSNHQVAFSYKPTLLPSTTYYWQIIAYNAGGVTYGPSWSFFTLSDSKLLVLIAGTRSEALVRRGTVSIHEVPNAQTNNASMVLNQEPSVGKSVLIGLGALDTDHLIFAGEMQVEVDALDETKENPKWPVSLVSHSFRLNKKYPFGSWTDVSATTVLRELIRDNAPGFTSVHVQESLPLITVSFDGTEDFLTCLNSVVNLVSGTTKVGYDRDIHAFKGLESDEVTPDALTATNTTLLKDTPIQLTHDLGQVRTRILGTGHGEAIPCDVPVGEFILPVDDAVMFNPNGGRVKAALTANGVLSQVLSYVGRVLGGIGTLVGPGVAPSAAPTAVPLGGVGMSAGLRRYEYTFVTGAGESLPSALGSVTHGPLSTPPNVTPASSSDGSGPEPGDHSYGATYVDAAGGETLAVLGATPVTTFDVAAPGDGSVDAVYQSVYDPSWTLGGQLIWKFTAVNGAGETPMGGVGVATTFVVSDFPAYYPYKSYSGKTPAVLPTGALGFRAYASRDGGVTYHSVMGGMGVSYLGPNQSCAAFFYYNSMAQFDAAAAPPVVNTAYVRRVYVAVPTGPAGTTMRRVYRTTAGAAAIYANLKLLTQIGDNITNFYLDGIADAALTTAAPSANTTNLGQTSLTGIALGPTGTTQRKLYRTAAGDTQPKLAATIANNTATTATDALADASLGANAPVGDTSGLTQPTGQVNAGATSLLTAGASFDAQGWVRVGQNLIRYTSLSGNTLSGIPTSGPGSITATIPYGSAVLTVPALVGINNYNGLYKAMLKGAQVHIFVQRDDLAAQAALGALELDDNGQTTDGIHEFSLVDERRGEDSLIEVCDAQLARLGGVIVRMEYDTRDRKTRAGRIVTNALPEFSDVAGDYVIQDVTISEIDIADNLLPRYKVVAASSIFTLQDLLKAVKT